MMHGLSLFSIYSLSLSPPLSMDQRPSRLTHSLIGIARWQLVLQKQASFFFASLSTLFGSRLLPPSYELSKVGRQHDPFYVEQTSQRYLPWLRDSPQDQQKKTTTIFQLFLLLLSKHHSFSFCYFSSHFVDNPFLQCSTNKY